ncbi:MAG: FAD-dependent oxidoreductase [Actinomycetota bacterium]|nr:FAD-dependent oxidoreductase [Actinomycetota bacterium]
MSNPSTFVVVGASLAGAKAAEALRAEGFDGRLVLVGEEPQRPYERPPLSKGYLRGEADPDKLYVHDEGFYAEHDIELRTETRTVAIDRPGSEVVDADGERIAYDRLLLATGAAARRLRIPGADLDRIFYLRDLADADRLRAALADAGRVAVVGGGWIGAEVAATVRDTGREVTMIHPDPAPLQRTLGPEIGQIYRTLHADHGVKLAMETSVAAFRGDSAVEEVVTSDGKTIAADLVVVGVGAVPRTELAADAGLDVEAGILVDDRLRTGDERIFAAGDVASAWHPLLERRVRVEHWGNALNQGPAAARNMLGHQTPYDRLPYFFSDQYDVGMEYVGYASDWDRVVFRGDPASREFIAFWVARDRVVAAMNVNVWDVVEPMRRVIASKQPVHDARLADSDVPIDELVPAP